MLRLAETMTLGGAALLTNPFFVKLGLIGLFLNSLLSSAWSHWRQVVLKSALGALDRDI